MKKPEQCQTTGKGPNLRPIGCVSMLLCNIKEIEKFEKQEFEKQQEAEKQKTEEPPLSYRPLQYYRGLSRDSHKLKPFVMRDTKHYENEEAMLRDLIRRHPAEFPSSPQLSTSGCSRNTTAFARGSSTSPRIPW